MSFKKREKPTPAETIGNTDSLLGGLLIAGFVLSVLVGIYGIIRFVKGR